MRKISLTWWLRIIFYIILSFLIYKGFNIAGAYYLISTNISTLIALILPLIFIESFRFRIYRTYFGLYINRKTLNFILEGFLYAFVPIALILIIGLVLGINIQFNKNLDLSVLSYFFMFLLISAAVEELGFRGLIFQTLVQRFDHRIIIFISAVIFSIAHYKNNFIDSLAFFNIFLAGIFFGFLLFKTLNLWICISFHFFWNFFQFFLLGSPISGYKASGYLLKLIPPENEIYRRFITGNEFGMESSFYVTIVLLTLIFYIIHKRPLNIRMHKIAIKRKLIERQKFLK